MTNPYIRFPPKDFTGGLESHLVSSPCLSEPFPLRPGWTIFTGPVNRSISLFARVALQSHLLLDWSGVIMVKQGAEPPPGQRKLTAIWAGQPRAPRTPPDDPKSPEAVAKRRRVSERAATAEVTRQLTFAGAEESAAEDTAVLDAEQPTPAASVLAPSKAEVDAAVAAPAEWGRPQPAKEQPYVQKLFGKVSSLTVDFLKRSLLSGRTKVTSALGQRAARVSPGCQVPASLAPFTPIASEPDLSKAAK